MGAHAPPRRLSATTRTPWRVLDEVRAEPLVKERQVMAVDAFLDPAAHEGLVRFDRHALIRFLSAGRRASPRAAW